MRSGRSSAALVNGRVGGASAKQLLTTHHLCSATNSYTIRPQRADSGGRSQCQIRRTRLVRFLWERMDQRMPRYANRQAADLVSTRDGSTECSGHAMLAELLIEASASFETDRRKAKFCIQQATELLRGGQNRRSSRVEVPIVKGGLAPWQARRVAAYIESNVCSKIRPAELAGLVRLSKGHSSAHSGRASVQLPWPTSCDNASCAPRRSWQAPRSLSLRSHSTVA